MNNIIAAEYGEKLKYLKVVFKNVKRNIIVSLTAAFSVIFAVIILDKIFPLKVDLEYSPVIQTSDKTLIHSFLTSDEKWRMYTTLEEITPTLKKAIIFKEDQYFSYHFGINPFSIIRAIINNITSGKRTSGASTITMQVARMLEPKERSYWNKIIEMFRAIQLELHMNKDEILQLYLNLVPFGGNIEGVKAASLIYFEKMPDHLSLAETTVLCIVPNRPNSLRIGRSNEFIKEERNEWLKYFSNASLFEQNDLEDARQEDLNAQRNSLPRFAPHYSFRIKNRYPSKRIIRAPIDLNMQLLVESLVKNYSGNLRQYNILNSSVLIIDNQSMQVKAYVGSSDFFNSEDGGQVDGIRAIRSPGSTLKPLLYGMAIDEGILTPKSIIADVPVNFRGYQPKNYQENFNGQVTIEYALANSLNIPAVKTLHDIETRNFIDLLVSVGFKQIEKDKDDLGLSTILGGCGVTLEEMTSLYAAFANNGKFRKINLLSSDSAGNGKPVLSVPSNFMISEILTNVVRPDLPAQWKNSNALPKVAWKTGTSYGRRDAWSIGYNKKYTVGVWVGNFSGRGVPELTGVDMAAPLLFNVFNAIDKESSKEWFKMPNGVNFRHVCIKSGHTPNEFCTSQYIDYFIPGISPYEKCQHAKYVPVSKDSTRSYCSSCRPESGYVMALYQDHSPEMIAYYESENINYVKLPPHSEDCERVFVESIPKITSPVDKLEYMVDESDSLQLMLSCQAANNVEQVYWYINNRYYRSSLPNEQVFFTPPDGTVNISCADDKGRHSKIEIDVKKITF